MSTFMKNGFPFTPFTVWAKDYNRRLFKSDLMAGFSLSLLMAPQAMANAVLAGLPAYHGLYAAAIPGFIGALFGSSRQLVTMPAAVIGMLSAAALSPIASSGTAGYIAYVALLTLMVGGIQFFLGLLRMGILVNFLSSPVLEGFTNAAAILIGASQVGKLLGIEVERGARQLETFAKVVKVAVHYVHWPTVGMALLTLLILYLAKKYIKQLPDILVAVIITTLVSWGLGYERRMDVPLKSIHSDSAVALINSLDAIKAGLLDLESKRKNLLAELDGLDSSESDPATIMQYSYQLKIVALEVEQFKHDAALKRDLLRSVHLYEVIDPENPQAPPQLYEKDNMPEGISAGWRGWRIKASQGYFDPAGIAVDGGGEVLGHIPAGLPQLALPGFDYTVFFELFPSALIIAFISFAEAISIAKSMAAKRGQWVDPNQELIGQGLANISGGFFMAPPCSGSFSVSAVNFAYGAHSPVAAMVSSLTILVMLFSLTPFLYYLPIVVLAVAITRSVFKLINFSAVRRAWTAKWYDGVISMITFFATLYFAPNLDYGILSGVILTVMVSFYRTMRPKVIRLSSGPDFLSRDAEYHNLPECEHIAVLYFQQELIYSNAAVLEEHVLERIEHMPKLKHMHFVGNGINDIDASGEETLANLIRIMHKAGITVSVSGLTGSAADVLDRTGVLAMIGPGNIFRGLREAICTIHRRIHPNGLYCIKCPWNGYCGVSPNYCTLPDCSTEEVQPVSGSK